MRIDIITIFPEYFKNPFSHSIFKKKQENNLIEIKIHNLRDYSKNKQKSRRRLSIWRRSEWF